MQDSLQELTTFRSRRLLIEHTGLNDLFVHVQLVPVFFLQKLMKCHAFNSLNPFTWQRPRYALRLNRRTSDEGRALRWSDRYDGRDPGPADLGADSSQSRK